MENVFFIIIHKYDGRGNLKCLKSAEYSNNYLMTKHSLSLVSPESLLLHVVQSMWKNESAYPTSIFFVVFMLENLLRN